MPPKDFKCKQCGNCCKLGDAYDTSATEEDILLWKKKGRTDILECLQAFIFGLREEFFPIKATYGLGMSRT